MRRNNRFSVFRFGKPRALARGASFFIFTVFFLLISRAFADTDSWIIKKSTHFLLYYKSAPEDFIGRIVEKAEDYYDRIADGLGFRRFDFWLWDNRAKIYIHDNSADYQAATGQPSWSAGCAMTATKVIHTYPHAQQRFCEAILPHEMGHIIFREFVGFNNYAVPLWLEEGVATHQEKLRYAQAGRILRAAMENGDFMPLEKLSGFHPESTTDDRAVKLFYAEAFSIVNFLITKFGRDKFVLFCQNLREKKNLERALISSYPFSNLKELDTAWQKYLKNG